MTPTLSLIESKGDSGTRVDRRSLSISPNAQMHSQDRSITCIVRTGMQIDVLLKDIDV